MSNKYGLRGFCCGIPYRVSVDCFLERINKTQSFNHLTDEIIRGWLKGRFEIEMFGQRKKSTACYVDVGCSKCKGRGWFGIGRKDCSECVAIGKESSRKVRRWKGGEKFIGDAKRKHIWSEHNIGLLDDTSIEVKYAEAFERAANHRGYGYPAWVDDVQITGKHTDKDKADYLESIKRNFTFSTSKPKVKFDVDRGYSILARSIDMEETVIRLAMTFGCTCPITGEYIPPDQVSAINDAWHCHYVYNPKYDVEYKYHQLVDPLGFSASKHISRFQPCGNRTYWNCVTPFSKRGMKIIRNAATKCLNAMDGRIDNEWVLAEVMQSAILKRAA